MDLKRLFNFFKLCNLALLFWAYILYNKYGTGFQVYLTKII